jgi:hypothetical protein
MQLALEIVIMYDYENEIEPVTIRALLTTMIAHYEGMGVAGRNHRDTLRAYLDILDAGVLPSNRYAQALVHAWYFGLNGINPITTRKATLAEWLKIAYRLCGVTANLTPCAAELQATEVMQLLMDSALPHERADLQAEMDAIHC